MSRMVNVTINGSTVKFPASGNMKTLYEVQTSEGSLQTSDERIANHRGPMDVCLFTTPKGYQRLSMRPPPSDPLEAQPAPAPAPPPADDPMPWDPPTQQPAPKVANLPVTAMPTPQDTLSSEVKADRRAACQAAATLCAAELTLSGGLSELNMDRFGAIYAEVMGVLQG